MPTKTNEEEFGDPPGDISERYREFLDGMYFINDCNVHESVEYEASDIEEWYIPGREIHSSQKAYLIDDDKTLLYDTLTPAGKGRVLAVLDELIDDLDYLVVSHPEANHAGNTHHILEQYPNAKLIVPGRGSHHDLHGLADLDETEYSFANHGDKIDLGTHQIKLIEEMFFDHAMTIWMYESTEEVLFTADFMGYEHMDGECSLLSNELERGISKNQLRRFNGYAFTWFRFVDTDETDKEIDHLVDEYNPSVIAPAHGNVITSGATDHLKTMKEVIRDVAEVEDDTDPDIHTHQVLRVNYKI